MTLSQRIVSDPFTIALIRCKARQLCHRCDFSRSDFEDLCQGMRLYLLQKSHLFDAERGNLEAFVTKALKTWVAMELRFRGRSKRSESYRTASLENTPAECEQDGACLGAALREEDAHRRRQIRSISPAEQFELREAIDHVMAQLEPLDQLLITRVVDHGITAAAKQLGMSWRQVAGALTRIRSAFENAGFGPS